MNNWKDDGKKVFNQLGGIFLGWLLCGYFGALMIIILFALNLIIKVTRINEQEIDGEEVVVKDRQTILAEQRGKLSRYEVYGILQRLTQSGVEDGELAEAVVCFACLQPLSHPEMFRMHETIKGSLKWEKTTLGVFMPAREEIDNPEYAMYIASVGNFRVYRDGEYAYVLCINNSSADGSGRTADIYRVQYNQETLIPLSLAKNQIVRGWRTKLAG